MLERADVEHIYIVSMSEAISNEIYVIPSHTITATPQQAKPPGVATGISPVNNQKKTTPSASKHRKASQRSTPQAKPGRPHLNSSYHGSGLCIQLCSANHQTTTPPVTSRTSVKKIIKPQMSERLRFLRSRSSHESGSLS